MSLYYDIAYIKCEEQIDKLKDYLVSLGEEDIDKIICLTMDLEQFLKGYIESEVSDENN